MDNRSKFKSQAYTTSKRKKHKIYVTLGWATMLDRIQKAKAIKEKN